MRLKSSPIPWSGQGLSTARVVDVEGIEKGRSIMVETKIKSKTVSFLSSQLSMKKMNAYTARTRKRAISDCRLSPGLVLCGVCVLLCNVFWVVFVYWCVM